MGLRPVTGPGEFGRFPSTASTSIGAGLEGVLRERKSARNCIAVGAVYGAVCAKRLTACHCLPWSASASDMSLYRASCRHDTSHVQNLARVRVTAHFSCRVIAASCTCSTRSCALAGARSPRHVCSIAHRHDVQFQQMPRLALSRHRALGDELAMTRATYKICAAAAVISQCHSKTTCSQPGRQAGSCDCDGPRAARVHTLRGENCARAAFALYIMIVTI